MSTSKPVIHALHDPLDIHWPTYCSLEGNSELENSLSLYDWQRPSARDVLFTASIAPRRTGLPSLE